MAPTTIKTMMMHTPRIATPAIIPIPVADWNSASATTVVVVVVVEAVVVETVVEVTLVRVDDVIDDEVVVVVHEVNGQELASVPLPSLSAVHPPTKLTEDIDPTT